MQLKKINERLIGSILHVFGIPLILAFLGRLLMDRRAMFKAGPLSTNLRMIRSIFMLTDDKLNCRVCGYRSEVPPWGGDGRTPLYDFCPCCGVEHGYQDSTRIGARKYRDRWIAAGAEWEDDGFKPEGWLISEQLAAVSSDFQ